jgi:hypothetical protein
MRKEIVIVLFLSSILLVSAFAFSNVLTMTDSPDWFVNLFVLTR